MLVIGYTSWAIMHMETVYPQESLVYLMEMHEVVAPLLQKISHKTRVILTSQSRFKINAEQGRLRYYSIPFGDPTNDWGEAVFLLHLRRNSQHQTQLPPSGTPDALSESTARVVETRLGRRGSRPRNHLVPEVDDDGVWWWDTNLPLSLAESSECWELFIRGPAHHPLYKSTFHRSLDPNHAGTVTDGDQVIMMLNLVCNSVLGGREGLLWITRETGEKHLHVLI